MRIKSNTRYVTPIERIEPCPFCGSSATLKVATNGISWWVECLLEGEGCGARGSIVSSDACVGDASVMSAWNDRLKKNV